MNYLILAEPRSGSYLLCEDLKKTALVGYPREIADILGFSQSPDKALRIADFVEHSSLRSIGEFVEYLLAEVDTGGEAKGVKLESYGGMAFLEALSKRFEKNTDEVLLKCFEALHPFKLISIGRRDRLKQAISLYVSTHTNQWRSDQLPIDETIVEFDEIAILRVICDMATEEGLWSHVVSCANAECMSISYEEFIGDREAVVANALRFLEVDCSRWCYTPSDLVPFKSGIKSEYTARMKVFLAELMEGRRQG